MSDQTPNSLIKVDTPGYSKYTPKQIFIGLLTGFIELRLIGDVVNLYRTNLPLACGYGLLALIILLVVVICARSDYTLFNTERTLKFKFNRITKRDEIYKFAENTTSDKAKRFTGLEYVDDDGHLTFEKIRTFDSETCNRGFCYTVVPSDSRDLDSFMVGIERLYNSLPHGSIHKTIVAQSKTLTDLCAVYEEKLQNKSLPTPVRAGLKAKKDYFSHIKDRVGWMYVIFVGVGYYTNDEMANKRIDEIRSTYNKFLTITGIKVMPVTDANEYAALYAQMYHMKDLKGVDM